MTDEGVRLGTVEVVKIVQQDSHSCVLPTAEEVETNGLDEGTEARCVRCGRTWTLMRDLTSRRIGPPWRRRWRPSFSWWAKGSTDD